ncbi:MAG: glycosyltransferase family 4 protein, partial [Candidatus Kapaibacteriota bacterium]
TNLLPIAVFTKQLNKNYPKIIFYQQMQSGIKKKDIYHNWIYRNLDGAIVLTDIMKQMLTETTKINPEKVFVVPYGVDWEKFQQEKINRIQNRRIYNISLDAFVVGCIGRIEPLKGQDTLIEAFAMAQIENSLLVLVGNIDDKRYFKKLDILVRRLGIEDRIKFISFDFDISKIMSTFDVFVMPSLSETFGLVLIEAMASSLPVIATRSGGVPEIIDDGKNGLLFEPKQATQLCRHLRDLYKKTEYASALGFQALEKVKIKFDYSKNVYKFFEICKLIHSSG